MHQKLHVLTRTYFFDMLPNPSVVDTPTPGLSNDNNVEVTFVLQAVDEFGFPAVPQASLRS